MSVPVSPCQSGEGKTYTEGEEKNHTDVRRKYIPKLDAETFVFNMYPQKRKGVRFPYTFVFEIRQLF